MSRTACESRLGNVPSPRSDQISSRDLEVLAFIARFGLVPRRAVAIRAGTARSVTLARERRLREHGLIAVERGYRHLGPLAICTRLGLRASGHGELPVARLSLATLTHEAAVAIHAAVLERGGTRLLSEREILARERAAGTRTLSAALPGGRHHRPDLIRIDPAGEPPRAVEVELTTKGAARLDALLRAWRRAAIERRFAGVEYRCAPRTLPYLRRAVRRTKTAELIDVRAL